MSRRPTIDRLFDHQVRVWRPSVTRDEHGAEERSYTPALEPVGCALKRAASPLSDVGPGLAPSGRRRFYLRPDADVQPRDVLELTAGPDAAGHTTWEVDEPPVRPSGHHTQVDTIAWTGELEAAP